MTGGGSRENEEVTEWREGGSCGGVGGGERG